MPFTATLADELVLLSYDDVSGRPPRSSYLDLGLAGAVLTELALAGRIDVVAGAVAVVDARPIGDPVADPVLQRIAADARRRTAKQWVQKLKGLRQQVLDRLVEAGVLSPRESRALGTFRATRYPAAVAGSSLGPRADARARLSAAVLDGREPSARTAALVSLVRATGMRKPAFPGSPRRSTERRMAAISTGHWAAEAVKRAVADVQAASSGGGAAAVAASASLSC